MNPRLTKYQRATFALLIGLALMLATIVSAQSQSPSAGDQQSPRANDRFSHGPQPGTTAPEFTLKTINGETVRVSALWTSKPTLIMAGSYTCPVFRGKVDSFERLVREFGDRVNFVVLYTQEAHPKGDPSPYTGREWTTDANERDGILLPQPESAEERLTRAQTCAKAMKLTARVAVDGMDNSAWAAFGRAPNSACLIGRDGKVVAQQAWFNPGEMRSAIERLLKPSTGK